MIANANLVRDIQAKIKRRPTAQHDEDMIVIGVTASLALLWSTMVFAMVGFTHVFVS